MPSLDAVTFLLLFTYFSSEIMGTLISLIRFSLFLRGGYTLFSWGILRFFAFDGRKTGILY
jgi:hypothetical protein